MKSKYPQQIIFFLLIFLLSSCAPSTDDSIESYLGWDIPKTTMDNYLTSKMDEYNIPGLSMVIINKGEVVYHLTSGYANLEQKLPITHQTIFEGASLSKSVFAFFVMTYVEAGKLDLDKPLYTYLPYPDIAYDDRYKTITARMILSHRSGFPNWRENENIEGDSLKIKFDPGTSYEYSGEGYQYLAMVLKQIEGTDWEGLETVFQQKVAQPLGMKHTVFIQTPYTRKHKAEPYDEKSNRIEWKGDYWYQKTDGKFYAPSSIHSEPLDFSKWMIAVMKQQLLTPASYDELFTPHAKISTEGDDIPVAVYYTLGFAKPEIPFTHIFLHDGNNNGFTSAFVLDVKKDWGFVLFTNSEYGDELGLELFFYLLTGPHLTRIYIIAGIAFLSIILGIVFITRFVIIRMRDR